MLGDWNGDRPATAGHRSRTGSRSLLWDASQVPHRAVSRDQSLTGAARVFDPDDVATWPAGLRVQVAKWNGDLDGEEHWQDVAIPPALSVELESTLAGWRVLSYHSTRLLDHEVDRVRAEGLRPFSQDLFDRKIEEAVGVGAITAAEGDTLLRGHMYRCGEHPERGPLAREGQVWLVAGRADFEHDPEAFEELLLHWGGEGIYFAAGNERVKSKLQKLGKPSIVVVALPVIAPERPHSWWGPLANLLLAVHRGEPAHVDVCCWSPVSADAVLDVWQPGHQDYDVHARLPAR